MQKTLVKNGNPEAAMSEALDAEIADLVETVRETFDTMSGLEEKVKAAKDRLRVLLVERGENWKDDVGYARLLADSLRVNYDIHALDTLIIKDPLRNGWLKEYRKESTVRGGVQVR